MTDNATTQTWAIQTMVTTYATPAAATGFAIGTSGVAVTLPLWTCGWADNPTDSGKNYGNLALNVVKVSLSNSVAAKDTHVGFVLPRGAPFMKATGANEVEITSAGAYQCWMYGNYMPNDAVKTNYAEALKVTEWVAVVWPQGWLGVKVCETQSWMVCKIRTTATTSMN
ncbi:MAG: hypothetical protein QF535_14100 [Anaerolineales bacterium]|jgi:hypothetical protein|nr:hypothetical protein [Anaerolineales bacterium]